MTRSLEAERWDTEYEAGRYQDEPPVEFVETIISELGEEGKDQIGLYLGCGNGRNYMPLLTSGLNLHGMDISPAAIEQLKKKHPETQNKLYVGNVADLTAARVFDYMVAIQVFQHGDEQTIEKYFQKTSMALRPEGRLFLRVNSINTDIFHDHHVLDVNKHGGSTIVYDAGPKKDLKIHFFSEKELKELAKRHGFKITLPLYEVIETRQSPQTGTWAQWESIWQKQ